MRLSNTPNRYPFHTTYPAKLWSKARWLLNGWKDHCLLLLNFAGAWLTIIDGFGAPGDTILTATVIHNIKRRFPRLKINCITPNPELLRHDPSIDALNKPEGYFSVMSWYLELKIRRDGYTNVLHPTLSRLRLRDYQYKARVHLSDEEIALARRLIAHLPRPILTFNCHSKEPVKNWPQELWHELIERCGILGTIVHLGDDSEPCLMNVTRFAGQLSMRESAAVLAQSSVHIGPDSFLAHLANGVDVRSVIIFGGAHTPANLGYPENINLYRQTPCSPCWIEASSGEHCNYDLRCLREISVDDVFNAVTEIVMAKSPPSKAQQCRDSQDAPIHELSC